MSNSGRFKDMNPGMRPAGKSMPVDKDGVKASLVIADDGRDDHVGKRVAQKFDPKVDSNKAFGKASGLGQGPSAVQSLRPRDRTAFQDVVESRTAPKRPQGTAVDPNNVFGIANKKDGSVQDCMTAPDDADPPLSSSLRIPRNYGPGQQTMRDYGGQFSSDQQFGKPTPNDPSGSLVKGVFSWNGNDKPKATIVPAQAEKQRRGAGRVDPSTTAPLGYAPPADPNSASSLLNYDRQAQTRVARMADLARKARPETMKRGADRMLDLQRAFEEADADGSGKLNKDELANASVLDFQRALSNLSS
ncbi:hypothetical protein PTSG_07300 [Salpingoeca rosetta]|uniref:EF-hand domain-containing protein n=1 Tax=Salpingoeca rosetta (strain ATCC 50818 / BSB-021) TaxID=946362 RepID=F2UJ10_SALR5|nr:uncharacterized protein PTSG_07300 [Salpingoeca rosetta]EGD76958.1 hypothetical protein PTSG_07300 [Salpingoeca rosetta]|eukprot:XP_004990798.1 hypothetical protein PTSG_07300 [Salpingoeca rosetta]